MNSGSSGGGATATLSAGQVRGEVPPGWSSNPSSMSSRYRLVALAVLGVLVAGYLTLAEVDVLHHAWDPFFGNGSDQVLHSNFSKSFQRILYVPDAALGALGYLADVVLGFIGGPRRWRSMPWVTYVFSLVVLGSAIAGIALVIVQGTVVHHWCTLCLVSTGIGVVILGMSRLQEARAATEHIQRVHARGVPWLAALLGRDA